MWALRWCHISNRYKDFDKTKYFEEQYSKQTQIDFSLKMKWIGYVVHTEKSLPVNNVNCRILEFQKQRQMWSVLRVQRRQTHTHTHSHTPTHSTYACTHTFSFSDIFYFDLLLLLLEFLKLWLAGDYFFLHQKKPGVGWGRQALSGCSQCPGSVLQTVWFTESSTAWEDHFLYSKILCTF